jgi:hypothetical protein
MALALKNSKKLVIIISLLMLLTACRSENFTADALPWIGDEKILFKDDFSNTTGGWNTHEDTLSSLAYDNGGFRFTANVPDYQFWSVPGLNFKDVQVFTHALKISGSDNNLFGVLCRYRDEKNYYAFVISSDGYYGIYKVLEGNKSLINQESLGFSEVIERGNAINQIHAICQDDQLSLLVNNTPLLQVTDRDLPYGDVGLITGNYSESGIDILFDNFIVAKP